MTLLVDTSVWSLALRRDQESGVAQLSALRNALEGGEMVVTTGLILQELLQGFSGPRARNDIVERFVAPQQSRARRRTSASRCAPACTPERSNPRVTR
jgi:predicted nucleic acid-binding protein